MSGTFKKEYWRGVYCHVIIKGLAEYCIKSKAKAPLCPPPPQKTKTKPPQNQARGPGDANLQIRKKPNQKTETKENTKQNRITDEPIAKEKQATLPQIILNNVENLQGFYFLVIKPGKVAPWTNQIILSKSLSIKIYHE